MFEPNEIKKLREKMLLTQTEFAELLGVAFETVNRYENGKSTPTIKVKRKLAELMKQYNIEVKWWLPWLKE